MRPRLLDLFCGAGGAAVGYSRAGFDVVGVDLISQPHYPFEFHQADALTYPLEGFDAIHASPPCQAHSAMGTRHPDRTYPDLIPATRTRLIDADVPYIIENVEGAPLLNPTMLCGSSFGLPLQRHRLFEMPFDVMVPPCAHGMWPKKYPAYDHGTTYVTAFVSIYGGGAAGQPVTLWREAMGIDWMTKEEMAQAIPPVFTEFLGEHLLLAVTEPRTAA